MLDLLISRGAERLDHCLLKHSYASAFEFRCLPMKGVVISAFYLFFFLSFGDPKAGDRQLIQ